MAAHLENSNILVTGASSGIGWELARQIAPQAKTLVLVARREDRLQELARIISAECPKTRVIVKALDLRDPSAVESLIADLSQTTGTIDVLINNAGHGDFTPFESSNWEKTRSLLELNVVALTALTHRLLPAMVRQNRGAILNVSSGLGLIPLPGLSAYVGSKHYVTGFTESLRAELAGTGVVISQVCPGPVATQFEGMAGGKGSRLPASFRISAEQCAREAIAGLRRGKALIIPGVGVRWVLRLGALVPRPFFRVLIRRMGLKMRTSSGTSGL